MASVLITTIADDLHAYIIKDRLKKNFSVEAAIIEVDSLIGGASFNWFNDYQNIDTLPTQNGPIQISDIDLVWWRRSRADQTETEQFEEDAHKDLVCQDWRASIRGSLMTSFNGKWISHPESTDRASIKLQQLKLASQCGLRVPKTLVSNDPDKIREFITSCGGSVVVKAVSGTRLALLVAKRITVSDLPDDESIRLCPAIYQELIDGTQHLRINQFGDKTYAFSITSEKLDWRPKLTNNIKYQEVDSLISNFTSKYLERSNLAMGIFDVKLDPHGEPVFFEINPQGQFLFLEGIADYPLGYKFCEFIVSEI